MSKGGAGKVYFVLYLAVILELLIIIVERDEAEEHLVQKQKESMKIVQSILSQLQSGSGATGVITRQRDEITLKESGMDPEAEKLIRDERRYYVDVGVIDVSADIAKTEGDQSLNPDKKSSRLRELVEKSNVKELEYQVFYNASKDPNSPVFPVEEEIKDYTVRATPKREFTQAGMPPSDKPEYAGWKLVGVRKLTLDLDRTTNYRNPSYKIEEPGSGLSVRQYAPPKYDELTITDENIFMYDSSVTNVAASRQNGRYKKRIFVAHFKPSSEGWYKVRFASKTNNILGISSSGGPTQTISDDQEVSIGTVKLKVKDLRAVRKELERDLQGSEVVHAAENLVSTKDVEGFKRSIQEQAAKAAASLDSKERERASTIPLYGYIVQLLTPDASEGFDQNRGSSEFDVRVIKPPVQKQGDPFVTLPIEELQAFDRVPELRIPIQSGPNPDKPVVEGGGVGADVVPSQTPGTGTTRNWTLVINSLKQGSYTVKVTNRANGKEDVRTIALQVFPSTVKFSGRIEAGSSGPTIKIAPGSGNAIAPEAFTTTVGLSGASPQQGFAIKLPAIPCNTTAVPVKVEWNSQFASAPLVLAEERRNVAQAQPYFGAEPKDNYSRYQKFNEVGKEITVNPGSDCNEVESISIGKVTNEGNVPLKGSVTVQGNMIVARLDPARAANFKGGSITVEVIMKAKNKASGASVDETVMPVTIGFPKK